LVLCSSLARSEIFLKSSCGQSQTFFSNTLVRNVPKNRARDEQMQSTWIFMSHPSALKFACSAATDDSIVAACRAAARVLSAACSYSTLQNNNFWAIKGARYHKVATKKDIISIIISQSYSVTFNRFREPSASSAHRSPHGAKQTVDDATLHSP
jgi:hypothetical protein